METKDLAIQVPHGLHLRVAAKVVEKSREFKSKVVIYKGLSQSEVNSILGLLMLGAEKGAEIRIIAEGEDEKKAVQAVSDILMDGAGI